MYKTEGELTPFEHEHFKAFYRAWCFGAAHSESTTRRWKKERGLSSPYTRQEQKFLRFSFFAGEFLRAEEERAFDSKAHLAVALITVARIELLLQIHLIFRRDQVKSLPYFKIRAKRRSFVRTITALRLHEIFALARKVGLFEGVELRSSFLELLQTLRYPKNTDGALQYLRECRNHVHSGALANAVEKILADLPVDPAKAFNDFYFDFAGVAVNLLLELDRTCQVPTQGGLRPF